VSLAVAFVGLAACDDGVQSDDGLDALMQVQGAQFFRGALPQGNPAGPAVGAMRTISQQLRVGQTDRQLSGSVQNTAMSVALGLSGDDGYWVKPVGGADPILSDQLTFDALLSFSRFIGAGDHDVLVTASDSQGRFGPPSPMRFTFVDPNAPPQADLVFSLKWDVDADLDLHVVQPDGTEIWSRKITAYDPPVVGPIDQMAADAAGYLDFDSNSQCNIDGRNIENVIFKSNPPSGHYLARVDTFSLCGQTSARWTLTVTLHGAVVASAAGVSLPSDTRFPHERGAGALAAEVDVP
jgi:hypothetical protein